MSSSQPCQPRRTRTRKTSPAQPTAKSTVCAKTARRLFLQQQQRTHRLNQFHARHAQIAGVRVVAVSSLLSQFFEYHRTFFFIQPTELAKHVPQPRQQSSLHACADPAHTNHTSKFYIALSKYFEDNMRDWELNVVDDEVHQVYTSALIAFRTRVFGKNEHSEEVKPLASRLPTDNEDSAIALLLSLVSSCCLRMILEQTEGLFLIRSFSGNSHTHTHTHTRTHTHTYTHTHNKMASAKSVRVCICR